MSREHINWFQTPAGELAVKRLGPRDVSSYARIILGVMTAAYARAFEDEQRLLPEGSVQAFFDERASSQAERMDSYMAGGSRYFVAHRSSRYDMVPRNVVGVIKTSDSRASVRQKLRLGTPNCYVNDISVTQPREGIGSALLAVATCDYHGNARMVADVLPGSEKFFRHVNLIPAEEQPEAFSELEIGGVPLHERMVRYHSPYAGVITARQRLTQGKAWLADGLTHHVA